MEKFECELKFENDCAILSVVGRINEMTSKDLEKKVDEIFNGKNKFNRIVFDFEEIDYISSSGLRVILYTKKKMDALFGKNDEDEEEKDISDEEGVALEQTEESDEGTDKNDGQEQESAQAEEDQSESGVDPIDGSRVSVINVSNDIKEIFDMTGFDSIVEVK